jgi:hypothetical protein
MEMTDVQTTDVQTSDVQTSDAALSAAKEMEMPMGDAKVAGMEVEVEMSAAQTAGTSAPRAGKRTRRGGKTKATMRCHIIVVTKYALIKDGRPVKCTTSVHEQVNGIPAEMFGHSDGKYIYATHEAAQNAAREITEFDGRPFIIYGCDRSMTGKRHWHLTANGSGVHRIVERHAELFPDTRGWDRHDELCDHDVLFGAVRTRSRRLAPSRLSSAQLTTIHTAPIPKFRVNNLNK